MHKCVDPTKPPSTFNPRTNNSTILRDQAISRDLAIIERRIWLRQQEEIARKKRAKSFGKHVRHILTIFEHNWEPPKTPSFVRSHRREKEKQYQQFLKEMQLRIDKRLLLFEQHAEKHSLERIERRYHALLERGGLSADFVEGKSRAASAAGAITPQQYGTDCGSSSLITVNTENRNHLLAHIDTVHRLAHNSDDRYR